jgi:prophage regulatory protein
MGINPRSIAMLPIKGSFAMKLLSKRQLKELVLYSSQHIQRLENANRFPRRVRLGNGPRSRVGWIESEVMEWLRLRIDAREETHTNSE